MSRYQTQVDLDRIFQRASLLLLTQAELARRAGLHPLTISRIQTGKTTPTLRTIRALARAVGLRATDLVIGTAPTPP